MIQWRHRHFGQLTENAYEPMDNGLSIFDYAASEAEADRPQANEYATLVLNALRVVAYERNYSDSGIPQRVSYDTIRNYHADFKIKIPLPIFIRLMQVADGEQVKLLMDSRK